MITALAIAAVLLLAACGYCVRIGCRALMALCVQLERDRQVEYQHPVVAVPARPAPQWLRSEPSLATRFARIAAFRWVRQLSWRGGSRSSRYATAGEVRRV